MTFDMPRRALGLAAGLVACLAACLAVGTVPAAAAPPEGWETIDEPSVLEMLVVLGLVPLAVIAVITLLTYLPSMMRGGSGSGEMVWQERNEWFGGPRGGVEAAEDRAGQTAGTAAEGERGGAGARW